MGSRLGRLLMETAFDENNYCPCLMFQGQRNLMTLAAKPHLVPRRVGQAWFVFRCVRLVVVVSDD